MNLEGVRPVRRRSRRHLGQTIGNYRQRMHQQRQTSHLHRCLDSRIYPLSRCRMFQDMSPVDSLQDYLQTHRHHRRNAACLHRNDLPERVLSRARKEVATVPGTPGAFNSIDDVEPPNTAP